MRTHRDDEEDDAVRSSRKREGGKEEIDLRWRSADQEIDGRALQLGHIELGRGAKLTTV